jgi:hypothetical protein
MKTFSYPVLGVALTLAFGLYVWHLSSLNYCAIVGVETVCTSNYQEFLNSRPSEKGDSLAGIAGALAFLWIVITVMMQGQELRLQRIELERMREAAQEQSNYLKTENTLSRVNAIDSLVNAKIETLKSKLPTLQVLLFKVENSDLGQSPFLRLVEGSNDKVEQQFLSPTQVTRRLDDFMLKLRDVLSDATKSIEKREKPREIQVIMKLCQEILEDCKDGSDALSEKVFYDLKINSLQGALKKLSSNEHLWIDADQEDPQ